MAKTASAYLMLVRETRPEVYTAMSPEQTRNALDRWNEWVDSMVALGKLRDGQPLDDAVRMVTGPGGRVTDGPYVEAKELVGGYFFLTDTTLEEVTEIARRCPSLEHGMTVEIRPVADACHLALALGWSTMREPTSV